MKDFLHRTVSDSKRVSIKSDDGSSKRLDVGFTRTRTSDGFSCISLIVGNHKLEFSSSIYGDQYEQVAQEAANMLNQAIGNSCDLPEVDGNE